MMKAVLICGSPRKNGSTSKILNEISHALHENGFDISQHFINDLEIGYCGGHKTCEITGACIQHDDVQKVVNDMFSAQLVVVASPSYWGDITGQLKVFIDRCTPYCNTNPARISKANGTKGIAVAIRAGSNKSENENLVHTIEHFLGHLDIPLLAGFTAEGINTPDDLEGKAEVLKDAFNFGKSITAASLK